MSEDTPEKLQDHLAKERAREEWKRRVSTVVVYLLCPLSLAVLAFSAYSWPRTLGMSIEFLRSGRKAFEVARGGNLLDNLLWLDLSTMSALIVFLVSLTLFIGSGRLIVGRMRARTWEEFKARVFKTRLLPHGLGPVAVRLGLLGTLLSFVLIAMILFQKEASGSSRSETQSAATQPTATQPATMQSTTVQASSSPAPETGEKMAGGGKGNEERETDQTSVEAGQRSFAVFLFLCASLYSTLVGCAMGYFVVPVLEWVGAHAAGRAMISQYDAEVAEQQYAIRLEQASRELTLVAKQAGSVQDASRGLSECVEAIRETRVSLVEVSRHINDTADVAREVLEGRHAIRRAAGDLFRVCRAAESANELYMKQAEDAKTVASGLQEATSGTASQFLEAVAELKELTTLMRRDATTAAEELGGSLTGLLEGLQKNIRAITRTQAAQEELARKTAGSIAACAGPVVQASERIAAIASTLDNLARTGPGDAEGTRRVVGEVGAAVGEVGAAMDELQGSLESLHPARPASRPKAVDARRVGTDRSGAPTQGAEESAASSASAAGAGKRGLWHRLFGGDGNGQERGRQG